MRLQIVLNPETTGKQHDDKSKEQADDEAALDEIGSCGKQEGPD
ncbi:MULTISPECIES: hypothetical protein [Rhodobacterales]|jgi:hypothetical protein|nr:MULTISPECIES: hypothetical protein [Rhodobacterales]WJY23235.1 hypothetical protein QTA57_09290 [Fontisubflavum oceani]